jgi:hypothetical protein
MPLNPLAFESFEAFQEARRKEGLRLGWIPKSDLSVVEHGQLVTDNILEHHGVKGQKWGVRKERTSAQKDSRWLNKQVHITPESGMQHKRVTERVARDAGKAMRSDLRALNKSPEFSTREAKRAIKKEHFSKGFLNGQAKSPIANKYNQAASDIYMKHVKEQAEKRLEVSPSGKWKDELVIGKGYWSITLKRVDEAKHAGIENPDLEFRVRPVLDAEGYIVDVEFLDDTLAQGIEFVDNMLEHHGVKGQKWGVRRDRSSAVTVTDKKKSVKTSGGVGLPAHPDAIKVRTIGQKGKGSGLKALSDQELQDYAKRIQMEQNIKRLNYNEANLGKKFVLNLLGRSGNAQADVASATQTAKRVKKILVAAAA